MGRVIVTFSDIIISFCFFSGTMIKAEIVRKIESQQPGKYRKGFFSFYTAGLTFGAATRQTFFLFFYTNVSI